MHKIVLYESSIDNTGKNPTIEDITKFIDSAYLAHLKRPAKVERDDKNYYTVAVETGKVDIDYLTERLDTFNWLGTLSIEDMDSKTGVIIIKFTGQIEK